MYSFGSTYCLHRLPTLTVVFCHLRKLYPPFYNLYWYCSVLRYIFATTTSADFSLFVVTTKSLVRPPRVRRDNLPLMSLLHLLCRICAVSDFTLLCKLIHPCSALLWSFCSSVRVFASDFLQIPPHGGHPCPQLMVPTTTAHSGLSPPS